MPVTRSATRTASNVVKQASTKAQATAKAASAPGRPGRKRKVEEVSGLDTKDDTPTKVSRKASNSKKVATPASNGSTTTPTTVNDTGGSATNGLSVSDRYTVSDQSTFLPAKLTFSFEDARSHLINVDTRFGDLFSKMKCRPFEQLARMDPFRTLTTSILGQQISWLAARSITHKFIRLFDPSLPEKLPPPQDGGKVNYDFFPSAAQVANMDIATLRTAGLSGRKAEYVQDLASRFADGRLSATKIFESTDEELAEMLIAVRGIGRWTVDMFAMFSLRRPDILPVGDLGVQRGVLRWFLSLHSPKHPYTIAPSKLPKAPDEDEAKAEENNTDASQGISNSDAEAMKTEDDPKAGASSVLPASQSVDPVPRTPRKKAAESEEDDEEEDEIQIPTLPEPPTPFTPSINKTLSRAPPEQKKAHPLPDGLTADVLKSRLDGKKKIKGAFLTPQEMENLTEHWRPYRSLGVYYMWALAEEKPSKK